MPTVQENLQYWNDVYAWPDEGDEWSGIWGGSEAMWWHDIYPRIWSFLPAGHILEIAPGHGRCTRFLKEYCQYLSVVDLSPNCIEACRKRFGDSNNISFYVNDGKSLEMIPDQSVDFVFSFDSLVHAEAETLRSYVLQLGRKLKPNGVGFLHHSNLGGYPGGILLSKIGSRILPGALLQRLRNAGVVLAPAWRGKDVSADRFDQFCREASLYCVSQELINWANRRHLIDCFSVFGGTPPVSGKRTVMRNAGFLEQAKFCSLRRYPVRARYKSTA